MSEEDYNKREGTVRAHKQMKRKVCPPPSPSSRAFPSFKCNQAI